MKALVLLSGGIDSAVCLGLAVSKYGAENVNALCIEYGQKHIKETGAAKAIAAHYGVTFIPLDLTEMFRYSNSSLLQNANKDMPKGEYSPYEVSGVPSTYVPFRNGLFLSAAASIALSLNCGVIYYGAHTSDAGNAYPDCTSVFNGAMSTAVYEGSGRKLRIEAPLLDMTKTEVIKIGLEIKVPLALTWSCYEGGEEPCGVCGTCSDIKKAYLNCSV